MRFIAREMVNLFSISKFTNQLRKKNVFYLLRPGHPPHVPGFGRLLDDPVAILVPHKMLRSPSRKPGFFHPLVLKKEVNHSLGEETLPSSVPQVPSDFNLR